MQESQAEECELEINSSIVLKNSAIKLSFMLGKIEIVPNKFQSKNIRLSETCDWLDSLTEGVGERQIDKTNQFYNCKLGSNQIAEGAEIVNNRAFEDRVVKIQSSNEEKMSMAEK